ncbi:MAG TPA: aminoglycoside phosphotransferase [Microbacterium sp.]|uniref:maltokinase N-terminal cap-like domain-containing protein n=1 Tax=Microbacterium sp. TaxID=51671 RepID=UPI002C70CCF4|nr:aminoglycoside phosphotransferase [Microbacterium sp.]HWI32076.1 aminoglycoside phosphotransferase [Microbacterium sp.]
MDSTLACLAAWMPRQRWYAAKGRNPTLRFVASWDFPIDSGAPASGAPAAGIRIRTYLVADEGSLPPVTYQVPVVARATSSADPAAAHVIGNPEPGTTLIDGPFDPAYAAALLRMTSRGGEGRGSRTLARGVPVPSAPPVAQEVVAAVIAGEQSNTSIIYRPNDGMSVPVICKVFRQVHPGLNPDIELQTALAGAGSSRVPRTIGSVEGEWPDPVDGRASMKGSLAFAQEFFPDVEDAWRVALQAAADGEGFSDRAHALGVATAEVHVALSGLFPIHDCTAEDRDGIRDTWRRRLTTAIAEVPELATSEEAIESVYLRAAEDAWPALQRIHGDYHLGQVILVPGRGWVLLDFEGEPMRPMIERVRPDLALRDVAGMLRSFDYVAGSIRLDRPDRSRESVQEWARAARRSFLAGYAEASGADLGATRRLLDALELDKAVYEAIYESRNRPTWISIPLAAITRLIGPG